MATSSTTPIGYLSLFERAWRGEPSPLKCYATYNHLLVDCYGNFYPCALWFTTAEEQRKHPGHLHTRLLAHGSGNAAATRRVPRLLLELPFRNEPPAIQRAPS